MGNTSKNCPTATLIPKVDSFWIGANIPGKIVGAYNYTGGLPMYRQEITDEIAKGYPGFQREALGERLELEHWLGSDWVRNLSCMMKFDSEWQVLVL
ncbi:hypothetical protein JVT61DRAFT_1227 [Boletus reticuloceps]|uniref:Uncharacterized protein n=1 Tax=Boletus reticuloceps TaxID=495285 RepID=A0A8I2YS80_9AGAM|nr:hypothetical protein JVT61DRAFT_1227 [Boletus reticuloceps]